MATRAMHEVRQPRYVNGASFVAFGQVSEKRVIGKWQTRTRKLRRVVGRGTITGGANRS
jgi:hypothetical protein